MTLLILRVERNVTDVVLTLSQATARSLAIQALNEAASEMLGLGVHYADLMTVEKDEKPFTYTVTGDKIVIYSGDATVSWEIESFTEKKITGSTDDGEKLVLVKK